MEAVVSDYGHLIKQSIVARYRRPAIVFCDRWVSSASPYFVDDAHTLPYDERVCLDDLLRYDDWRRRWFRLARLLYDRSSFYSSLAPPFYGSLDLLYNSRLLCPCSFELLKDSGLPEA